MFLALRKINEGWTNLLLVLRDWACRKEGFFLAKHWNVVQFTVNLFLPFNEVNLRITKWMQDLPLHSRPCLCFIYRQKLYFANLTVLMPDNLSVLHRMSDRRRLQLDFWTSLKIHLFETVIGTQHLQESCSWWVRFLLMWKFVNDFRELFDLVCMTILTWGPRLLNSKILLTGS